MKTSRISWIKNFILILVVEKIVQHTLVTLAFKNNLNDIRSMVVVNPDVLMILGAILAILFVVSLFGLLANRLWSLDLLIGLAIADIIGEFIAQGVIAIVITVSLLVAIALLGLVVIYRWQLKRSATRSNGAADA